MNKLLKDLNIDETYTKPIKKEKIFTTVKSQIPLKKYLNYFADLLFLPETKEKYKYLLVVVDIASNQFDIEPLKTKQPTEILTAFKKMFKRPYIHKPEASIKTDAGHEFKGDFNEFLYKNIILHKVALPSRHKQMSNVENLNKQLGRLINGYLNTKEEQTGQIYKEWLSIIPTIRTELNKIRVFKPALNPDYVFKTNIPEFNFNYIIIKK